MAFDLPDHVSLQQETAYCMVTASQRFNLPLNGLLAILLQENGRIGARSSNKNGSFDLGPMQVNTVWLKSDSPLYGYVTAEQVQNNLCTNIHSAAWIWSSQFKSSKDLWASVGYYHSPGNPALAWKYKVAINAKLPKAQSIILSNPYYRYYVGQLYGAKSIE